MIINLRNTILSVTLLLVTSIAVKAQDSTFHSSKKDTTTFVQIIQDPQIDIINNYYKGVSSVDTLVNGYRIQIYFGSRTKAYDKKGEFETSFPDIEAKIIYEEPNFKTVVGGYITKLDADRELRKFQLEFPDAFIIRNEVKRE